MEICSQTNSEELNKVDQRLWLVRYTGNMNFMLFARNEAPQLYCLKDSSVPGLI